MAEKGDQQNKDQPQGDYLNLKVKAQVALISFIKLIEIGWRRSIL